MLGLTDKTLTFYMTKSDSYCRRITLRNIEILWPLFSIAFLTQVGFFLGILRDILLSFMEFILV